MRKLGLILFILCAVPAMAQQINLQSLDSLSSKAKEKTEVALDESTLKLASGFLSEKNADEAAARQITEGLKSVNVRVFEFDRTGVYTQADLQPIRDQLKAPQWKRIVNVQEDGEDTEIWISQDATNKTDGILIIAAEETELTVVNVVGNIDMKNLGNLGGRLGIPELSGGDKKD
jgi:hypothetical protein